MRRSERSVMECGGEEGEMEVAISDVMFGANDPPMLTTETVHSTRVLVRISIREEHKFT